MVPPDDGNRQRTVELGALAQASGHRQHAGKQRKRGHQNRTMAQPPGMHQRCLALGALRLFLARAVEQQNGVLGDQPHQRHGPQERDNEFTPDNTNK